MWFCHSNRPDPVLTSQLNEVLRLNELLRKSHGDLLNNYNTDTAKLKAALGDSVRNLEYARAGRDSAVKEMEIQKAMGLVALNALSEQTDRANSLQSQLDAMSAKCENMKSMILQFREIATTAVEAM